MGTVKTTITNTRITIREPKLKKEDKTIVLSSYPVWVEFRTINQNWGACFITNNFGQIIVPSDVGYDIWISQYDTITKKKAKFIYKIDKNLLGKKVNIEVIKTLVKNRTVKFENVLHEADLKIIASELGHKYPTVFGNKRFSAFAVELNKMMTTYQINTRLRLIHFLAQTYHETQGFSSLKENGSISYFKTKDYGADFYGRGLLHLTWDYGYLEYYSHLHEDPQPSYHEVYNELKNKTGLKNPPDKVSLYAGESYSIKDAKGKITATRTLPKDIVTTLTKFAPSLETNLSLACDSAGWFWENKKMNTLVDNDDARAVSIKLNGGENGLDERIKYTKILRKVII